MFGRNKFDYLTNKNKNLENYISELELQIKTLTKERDSYKKISEKNSLMVEKLNEETRKVRDEYTTALSETTALKNKYKMLIDTAEQEKKKYKEMVIELLRNLKDNKI